MTDRSGTSSDAGAFDSATTTRRVLICAAEFPPLGGGGVLRVAKLAKYLPTLGWQLTVACSEEPLAETVDRSLLEEIPDTVRVLRLRPPLGGLAARATAEAKTRVPRRSPVFGLLIGARAALRATVAVPDRWLPWALTLARRSATNLGGPDVVVTSGPPHSAHIAGAVLARRLRVPFVMDMRDEWSLRPLMRSRLRWRRTIDARVERWCLRRAAQLVVVSDTSAQRYASLYPWLAGRLSVIPNGYDPADLPDSNSITCESARDVVTLGYAGSFQVGLDLRPLFQAIGQTLATENPSGRRARFVMLGAFRPEEADLARRLIADDALTIERFLPHREALACMASWDVLLVVADDGESSLAGKVYESLALRKPILVVAPDSPATRLVAAAGAGVSAAPHETDGISTALRRALALALDPSFRGAPDEVLAKFDRRHQAQTWSELLGRLVDGDRVATR
jgi:glycosyltransferase involved in cell wall biosynthesis